MGFREIVSARIVKYLPHLSIALLLIGILFFNNVLEIRAAEGRRAMVTYEMMENGDLLTPYLHGHPYYNKPPFYNWVIALFFYAFDSINHWVLRLPGVLSLISTAILFFLFAKQYVRKEVALLGAAATLTITDMLFYGSVNAGEIDLFYALLTSLQVLAIFHYQQKKKWLLLFVVSYALAAIGTLTKGLPSLAFQALTLLAWFTYTKNFKRLFGWQHMIGIAILLTVSISYFWLYSLNGEALGYVINTFKQASQRSANEYGMLDVIGNLFIFPFEFLRRLLPWSLAIVFIFSKPIRSQIKQNPFISFVVIFILVNIPIYWSAPELRIRYTYMFFPFFAMLFAWLLDRGFENLSKAHIVLKHIIGTALAIGSLALIGIGFVIDSLPTLHVIILIFSGIIFGSLVMLIWKTKWNLESYWILVFALAVTRMAYNLVGMPYTASTIHDYSEMTEDMIEISNDKPIHYYGQLVQLKPNLSLFGHDYYRDTLLIPKDLTAGFGYYDALLRDEVMDNATEVVTGDYYLLYENERTDQLEPLDTIPKMMGGKNFLFCRGI
jgi:4-amino-4-deoxy-L-arabinose transferase-like glycosyltransferase